jgi:hypothetical protein
MVDVLTDFSGPEWTPQYVKDERLRKQQEAIAAQRRTIISVDLGRNVDRSVITGLDITPHEAVVKNVEVFQRQTYNTLAERLLVIRAAVPHAALVFDCTGVGVAVLDLFLEKGIQPDLAVVITSSASVNYSRDMTGTPRMSIGKANLIAHITKILNEGRIAINPNAPGAALLQQELKEFQAVVRSTGTVAYEAPQGKHDDCVLSLAIGLAAYGRILQLTNRPQASMRRLY